MGLSKISEMCMCCPQRDNCSNKKMEACAYIIPNELLAQPATEPLSQQLMQEMAVKHNYRNVKIAENTTVTIDLQELKKKLEADFYKQVGLGCLREG